MSNKTGGDFIQHYHLIKHFIAGGAGGICGLVTGHPLDTIKLRLQTQSLIKAGTTSAVYSGVMDCARKMYVREGFFGFYKGMLAPLAMAVPITALSFLGYACGKKLQTPSGNNGQYSLGQVFQAGSFSTIFLMPIVPACDRVKCLLQVQKTSGSAAKYSGIVDCLKTSFREAGLFRGVYRGTVATAVRDFPGAGFFFMTYEGMLRCCESQQNRSQHQRSVAQIILSGGCAGVVYWSYSIVPDIVKSKIQTAPEGLYPNGLRDVVVQTWTQDGLRGFFKGFTPVLVRAVPASAAQFLGYEAVMKFLHHYT